MIGIGLGFANPHYLLGKMLLKGLGTETNYAEGISHLRTAIEMGHPNAKEIKKFLASLPE
jgi:TPR repeat protein